uniref:Mitochondrial inner membrane protease subunit 2 n=2 Tax=Triticinae TaxID=1648030 RepID=A0A453LBJ5_AEGTS
DASSGSWVWWTPVDHQRKAIKRVIGLPGDWISVPETKEIRKIPEGHCWVEGDNGSVSRDSRTYGPVPLGLVQGRVTHVVWPPRKIGRVDKRVPEGRVMPQRNL